MPVPFHDWKVCNTGAGEYFCPNPIPSESENQSQSELLEDAYSSCHLWARQNQLTFLCGLEMKEMLQQPGDGIAERTRVSLLVCGHPRVLHRGT